ncbi:MAG: hypothetical protein KF819_09060 [Labilithrix sp.]|nr:hypothetical protein [Labilithrix sp.]
MRRAAIFLVACACSSSAPSGPSTPSDDAGADAPASALPQTCARGAKNSAPVTTCNGAAALCERTYDKVVVPMTHNAMSASDESWSVPNQTHGLARQLADGIRGMMLDTKYYDVESSQNAPSKIEGVTTVDQIYLCHGPCALGKTRLLDGLCALTRFLDENPGEVLSVIFENDVADPDTDEVLRASGLADYLYTHAPGTPWPTLREMIDGGKRLVVFVERGGGAPAHLHPAFEGNIWDTPYAFESQATFSCQKNRGATTSPLFLMNHWLSKPFGDIAYAREVNVAAVLGKRLEQCTTEAGRAPTFVGVDFYEVGDLFAVVRAANGLP